MLDTKELVPRMKSKNNRTRHRFSCTLLVAMSLCLGLIQGCDEPSSDGAPNGAPDGAPDAPQDPGSNPAQDLSLGITAQIPEALDPVIKKNFNRYTSVKAPNGKAIHIVAQNKISTGQMLRARGILEHYLKSYPGSRHGADKSGIANQMANNGAVLCLLNGQDDGKNPVGDRAPCQPLYQNEMQVEGHAWYMDQNFEHRDASFEEILHMVHDTGIGVDGPNSFPGAAPEFQKEIRAAQKHALANNIWGMDSEDWIQELEQENSLSQEYWASVVDAYYGLWGANQEQPNPGMGGIYVAGTRAGIQEKDVSGFKLMDRGFMHPYLTYTARVDEGFRGVFSLRFREDLPYTHHARYLKNIQFLGSNDTELVVNELDNEVTGNAGRNVVRFSGARKDYEVISEQDQVIVVDQRQDGDGRNLLKNVEALQFSDQLLSLESSRR